jgi:MauM/NapG family ferredoxin protein
MLLPSRRAFLGASVFGAVLAGVQYNGAHSLLNADGDGTIWSPSCIRPQGALPESRFLQLCLRCGECMKVCPDNALQPAWLAAGPEGIFSPLLTPRRGPCEPGCNACGQICPTRAIAPLPLEEKQWAKVGTAIVNRQTCLAWAEELSCVVCQEVCPYGTVTPVQQSGARVPTPMVDAARCYGCGYCERHCPVRISAIVIQPLNALHLDGNRTWLPEKPPGWTCGCKTKTTRPMGLHPTQCRRTEHCRRASANNARSVFNQWPKYLTRGYWVLALLFIFRNTLQGLGQSAARNTSGLWSSIAAVKYSAITSSLSR